jgi:hypothetical protein
LLFYDGWLLPLSFSKLAKTSESRCCHSVSQTVRNSWSRAVTVDFSVGPSEPAASAHPCKANYPIYSRSPNPFDIHSSTSIIRPVLTL